ncbi:hypothetical protein GCM10007893_24970 [Paracoccus marinus]|nr:hypothetical protein GCM10007893_24970 [Paracoccus marinus]
MPDDTQYTRKHRLLPARVGGGVLHPRFSISFYRSTGQPLHRDLPYPQLPSSCRLKRQDRRDRAGPGVKKNLIGKTTAGGQGGSGAAGEERCAPKGAARTSG